MTAPSLAPASNGRGTPFTEDGTYSTKPMTGEVVGVDCVDMQTVWVQPDRPKSAKPTVVGIHQG